MWNRASFAVALVTLCAFGCAGDHPNNGPTTDAAPPGPAVHARWAWSDPDGGPFPSDLFTVADPDQLTGLRVNLPRPDCSVSVSDCLDLVHINELDGFSLQPRVTIPFDGDIDPNNLPANSIFVVDLETARQIPIVQTVWD